MFFGFCGICVAGRSQHGFDSSAVAEFVGAILSECIAFFQVAEDFDQSIHDLPLLHINPFDCTVVYSANERLEWCGNNAGDRHEKRRRGSASGPVNFAEHARENLKLRIEIVQLDRHGSRVLIEVVADTRNSTRKAATGEG